MLHSGPIQARTYLSRITSPRTQQVPSVQAKEKAPKWWRKKRCHLLKCKTKQKRQRPAAPGLKCGTVKSGRGSPRQAVALSRTRHIVHRITCHQGTPAFLTRDPVTCAIV
ncbi:Hypothetical predicted protein [Pelobates cultripes]|uniref:Uncharacterized protein n=1 Tax=Pelobates cultripes TaxID=61616 RepID=A0AAD1SC35_PELCU|nr:Hypothetical predicted protein [Pelobates cultripes]